MKHIKITHKHQSFDRDIPTSWAELDADGMQLAAQLWSGGIHSDELLSRFFGVPLSVVHALDSYFVYCLTQLTSWMRRLDDSVDDFKIAVLPDTAYLAPTPRLGGCTLEQFMLADTHFQRYAITADPDHLTLFIAALYHAPRRRDDDMDAKVNAVEHLPDTVRQAIFLNFILIRRWLSRSYPYLFPPPDNEQPDTDDEPQAKHKKPRPTDWLAIFDAFMGDDVAFIERYKRMAAIDAFRLMNRRIKQSRQPH
jgi:hypothetical protein